MKMFSIIRRLIIPKTYYKKLEIIKRLNLEQRTALIQELEKLPTKYIDLSSQEIDLIIQNTGINQDELKDLLDLFFEVYYIQYIHEKSQESFIEKLKDAIKNTNQENIIPADDDWEDYMAFWKSILSMDKTIGLIAKAKHFREDFQNTYGDAVIYTEIRPIFPSNIKQDLLDTAILYHNLKIEYKQAFLPEQFFISLNSEDLRNLKIIIDRAFEKEEIIKQLFREKNLKLIKKKE